MSLITAQIKLLGTEHAFRIGPKIREVEAGGQRVIRCNLGEPDFPLPVHIRDEVIRQLMQDNTHYCDPQGLPSLRSAIARHFSETRGIDVAPDRVVVFPGAKPPIGFCQQVYLEPGDEVVYPSPGFPIYESFIRYLGARPVPLHLSPDNGFALERRDLLPLLSPRTKLIILNTPSNPTGGVASTAQLRELAEIILSRAPRDYRVYSDEVYEDILFDGARHASIASVPGMAERTILVSGASKSFAWTGGRVGWAAFPTVEEAQIFTNLNVNYFSCVPPYNQEGARLGLESPESREAIGRMVVEFQRRRDELVPALRGIPGVSCHLPRGAFYAFPDITGLCERLGVLRAFESLPEGRKVQTSPATMFQMFLLYRYGVATMDRQSFGRLGAEGKHYLRVSFATGMEDLLEAVRRMNEAVNDRPGFENFVREGKHLN